MLNCFLAHFEADVFSEGEDLQTYELFAEVFSEALAHAAEELDCDDAVVFVLVVVGHFDDVFEDEIAPILVIEFMRERSELFACLFLDLCGTCLTSRRLEFRKKLSTGISRFLMLSCRLSSFSSCLAISPTF